MIKTKEQYETTKYWLSQFSRSLRILTEYYTDTEGELTKLQMDSVQKQIKKFQRDIQEYEK